MKFLSRTSRKEKTEEEKYEEEVKYLNEVLLVSSYPKNLSAIKEDTQELLPQLNQSNLNRMKVHMGLLQERKDLKAINSNRKSQQTNQ